MKKFSDERFRLSSDNYYAANYETILNRDSVGFVSNLVHKSLERHTKDSEFANVLELGAGKGQHLKFIKHSFNQYFETDIRLENLPDRLVVNDDITPLFLFHKNVTGRCGKSEKF